MTKKKSKKPLLVKSLRQSVQAVRSKTIADIKQIRLLWAKGMTDLEIREHLKMSWREWYRRVRIMREVPPDDEVISVAKRYMHEHNRAVSRLETRMKQLQEIHDKAAEEITIFDRKQIDKKTKKPLALYTRPRDMGLAASTARDLAMLDREILRSEQELIAMKQRLGLIETYLPPSDPDSVFDNAVVITTPNLMKAWAKRKAMELEGKKPKLVNGEVTDAEISKPDSSSTDKVAARRSS